MMAASAPREIPNTITSKSSPSRSVFDPILVSSQADSKSTGHSPGIKSLRYDGPAKTVLFPGHRNGLRLEVNIGSQFNLGTWKKNVFMRQVLQQTRLLDLQRLPE